LSFSRDLISHAIYLAANGTSVDGTSFTQNEQQRSISQRRAVSAAYYALFHHLNGSAVDLIAPNVQSETNHRIQRWFEHAEMKRVCGRFLSTKLDQPLLDLIGGTASTDLRNVAQSFITLQEARHDADYNLGFTLGSEEAQKLIILALVAMNSWDRISSSAEANIFILSLLMWKNWGKER
jgi:uncharacterized protein (UPF0332 family)